MARELSMGMEEILEGSSVVNAEDRVDTGLKVKRRKYVSKKNKEEYWLYYLIATIRGRSFEVNLVPGSKDDVGGFVLMDLAFGEFGEVPLYKTDFTWKNNAGEETSGVRYEIGFSDELGDVFVTIKPSKASDKALLQLALDHAAKLKALAEKEANIKDSPPDVPEKNKKG